MTIKTKAKKPISVKHCQICGSLFKRHTKCSQCGILIGRGHEETAIGKIVEGKIICGFCADWYMRTGRLRDGE